jgi:microcystin-dependent protein
MKVKVYVIDLPVPNVVKRRAVQLGIPAFAVLAGGVALAGLPTSEYKDGSPLTAQALTDNFTYLQNEIAAAVPPGTVVAFAGPVVPTGWLLCDGSPVSRTTYAGLFSAVGTVSGSGDGATTFNLPDYRGMFLRGVDTGDPNHRDPDSSGRTAAANGGNVGSAVGSVEAAAFASHSHGVTDPGHHHGLYPSGPPGNGVNSTSSENANGDIDYGNTYSASATTGITIQAAGGSETRPVNAYVNYIIKD